MVKKVGFRVVHISGIDDGYTQHDLEVQSPVSKGWQSSRFCNYPQEVILKMNEITLVKQVQLLSHQYNVATKIEVYFGMPEHADKTSVTCCKFKRLGTDDGLIPKRYVMLASNEQSNFQSRELKSIHLDNEKSLYIKLLLHKNHVNQHNLYNQVSIVAINILGQPLSEKPTPSTNPLTVEDLVEKYMTTSPYTDYQVSNYDDLTFDLYQDPETGCLIRRLEEKKRQAVLDERFDYAKKLKLVMADLQRVGAKLASLEIEKKRAIQREDYDAAQLKKVQGDEYRLHTYKQLDIHALLEITPLKIASEHETTAQNEPSKSFHRSAHQLKTEIKSKNRDGNSVAEIRTKGKEEIVLPPVVMAIEPTNKPVEVTESQIPSLPHLKSNQSVANVIANNNDDRPLPTTNYGQEVTENTDEKNNNEVASEIQLPVLSEKEEREASLVIDLFGMNMTQKLFSKSWKHRQEMLEGVHGELSGDIDHPPRVVSQGVLTVLQKSLQDQVFVVINEAVSLLKELITAYIPQHSLGKHEIQLILEKVIPIMMKRTGDGAHRTRSLMIDSIKSIAHLPHVKSLGSVPSLVAKGVKSKNKLPWRLIKSQIDIMNDLIKDLGLDTPLGFSTEHVMKLLLTALEHQNSEVRESALNCIFQIYNLSKGIKKYLPVDDPSTRKNPLYVKLFDGLDRIDGIPTETQRKEIEKEERRKSNEKKQKKNEEEIEKEERRKSNEKKQKKNEEVKALQEQNEEIKKLMKETNEKKKRKNSLGGGGEGNKEEASLKKEEEDGVTNSLCIFCGVTTQEASIDVHYWKSCPMLKRCVSCSQVVEISTMSEHLVNECSSKQDYHKCTECNVALLQQTKHKCPGSNDEKVTCPLCFSQLPDTEKDWSEHLTGNCQVNKKRINKDKPSNAESEKPRPAMKSRLPKPTPKKK